MIGTRTRFRQPSVKLAVEDPLPGAAAPLACGDGNGDLGTNNPSLHGGGHAFLAGAAVLRLRPPLGPTKTGKETSIRVERRANMGHQKVFVVAQLMELPRQAPQPSRARTLRFPTGLAADCRGSVSLAPQPRAPGCHGSHLASSRLRRWPVAQSTGSPINGLRNSEA